MKLGLGSAEIRVRVSGFHMEHKRPEPGRVELFSIMEANLLLDSLGT